MRNIWILVGLALPGLCVGALDISQPNELESIDKSAVLPCSKQESPLSTLCALSTDIQALWNRQKDAVVKVMGSKKGNNGPESLLFGTGFFADPEGNILTTATIVTEAENLWVEYQGLSYAATVVGKDPVTNIAVINLLKKPEHFTPVLLPETPYFTATPEGCIVIAIGCVLGMEPAPLWGLITGKNIVFDGRVFATTYLRTDIGMCGGESGAPVFNADGSLCGILIASLPELRSSFIISAHALTRISNDIVKWKSVPYCSAGFSVRGQMTELGGKEVIISAIDAQKIKYSGTETLQLGDTIAKIGAQNIANESDIADILFFKHPGEVINIQVIRNGKAVQISILLGEKIF
ncbi:MAG: S1C family serine protease [Puniceicoccales bacterium]|jgi:S1-C subfamily serine protease|nr:S1C family serine protease [Puniceicoccales bacterium]